MKDREKERESHEHIDVAEMLLCFFLVSFPIPLFPKRVLFSIFVFSAEYY